MPYYEYACENCGEEFEKYVPYNEGTRTTVKCPACKKFKAKKQISVPRVIFKGKGFYSTDTEIERRKNNGK